MLQIERSYLERLEAASTPGELQELILAAMRLEHATIPPYLAAAYSLKSANSVIRKTIIEVAEEEMLHMGIVANLMLAVGGQARFHDPSFLQVYPGPLPMTIAGDLEVGIRKFSKELVRDVFMRIEEPENPLVFLPRSLTPVTKPPHTIGAFYRKMIQKIQELGDGIFTGDPTNQVVVDAGFPSEQLFPIIDVESAVRALNWIVDEGEGTENSPFDGEGEPAHYYRFAEIYHGHRLVPDENSENGFSYTGEPVPFNPDQVWDLPDNPKVSDYPAGSTSREMVVAFNTSYMSVLRALDATYGGAPAHIGTAISTMTLMKRVAQNVVATTDPSSQKNLGLTFEFLTV